MNPYYLMQRLGESWVAADEGFTQFYEVQPDSWNKDRDTPILPGVRHPLIPYFKFRPLLGQPKPNFYLLGIPYTGGTSIHDSSVGLFEDSLRAESWKRTVYPAFVSPYTSGLYDIGTDRRLMQGVILQDLGSCVKEHFISDESGVSSPGVSEAVKLSVTEQAGLYSIGGDHSITHSLLSAFVEQMNKPIILIEFDAHHDCGIDALHHDRIHHANFVRHLLARDEIAAVVQLGLRGIRSVDQMYTHDKLIQISGERMEPQTIQRILSELRMNYPEAVAYLSFDMDCLDPGTFPYVDFPLSGGPSWPVVLQAVETVLRSDLYFIGGDLVEGQGVAASDRVPGQMELALRLMVHMLEGLHQNRMSQDCSLHIGGICHES